jgi:hypothetical protein
MRAVSNQRDGEPTDLRPAAIKDAVRPKQKISLER